MTCPIDSRPLTNNAVICGVCEETLARALGDLDALLEDLDTVLTRQDRKRPARGSVSADGPPLPFNERASEAARDLHYKMWHIIDEAAERIADEGRFVQMPTPRTPQSMASWMMLHLRWIVTHMANSADIYSEIVAAVNNIRRTIDIAPDTQYLGPCGGVFNDVECVETLYAVEGADTARCRTCTTVWDVAERMHDASIRAGAVAQTITVLTRSFALRGIALDSDRLGKWVARGYLKPYGVGPRKRPTYIVAHVARLIRLYENNEKLSPWPEQEQETA